MKILSLLLTLTLVSSLSNAQKTKTDKVYWTALDQYTQSLNSEESPNSSSSKEKVIYLQKPLYVDSVPSEMNGIKIITFTSVTQKSLYRSHHNKLIHTFMSPVTIEDSLMYIEISPYFGTLKGRRHYYLEISDGLTIYFKYDIKSRTFVFYKTEHWGI